MIASLPRRAKRATLASQLLAVSGTLRATRTMRVVRGFKYGSFIAAALVSYAFPSLLVSASFKGPWSVFAYVWSTFLLLGATTCLCGLVKRTWVGEFIGLWGVIFTLGVYAISCFGNAHTGQQVFLGLLVLAFSFSSFARWLDMLHQKKLVEYEARLRSGRRGL